MDMLLGEFIEVMDRQNRLLDQIAEIGQQKQQIIIAGKVKELDGLLQKEGALLSNLEKLEGDRFQLQQQISAARDAGGGMAPASELLQWAQREYPRHTARLEQAVNRLSYNLARLKAINQHNNELIEQSLQYIETMQALLNGDVAGTYSDKGNPNDEAPGRQMNLLDTRA